MSVAAADKGFKVSIANQKTTSTTLKNYISILQNVGEKFAEEINSIRTKLKVIEKTEEVANETTLLVDNVTENAEEIAHKLQSVRVALKHKITCVEELEYEVVALRADCSDILSVSKWNECEVEYRMEEETIEERRIEELKKEKVELETSLTIVKAQYKTALTDLCEVDEKLRHLRMLSEDIEENREKELMKLKEMAKARNKLYPSADEIQVLRQSVQELRKKIGTMEKRRRSERAEYRHIQQQCLDAADRIKELGYLVGNKDTESKQTWREDTVDDFTETEIHSFNARTLKLEDISTSVDSL